MVPPKSHPERLRLWIPHQREGREQVLCILKGLGTIEVGPGVEDAEASLPGKVGPGFTHRLWKQQRRGQEAPLRAGHAPGLQLLITGLVELQALQRLQVLLPPGLGPSPIQQVTLLWATKSKNKRIIKLNFYPYEPHLYQMAQSLCLKLFIKRAFVRSWDRRQALEASHQEAGQKVLRKTTFDRGGGVGRVGGLRSSLPPPQEGPGYSGLSRSSSPSAQLCFRRRQSS